MVASEGEDWRYDSLDEFAADYRGNVRRAHVYASAPGYAITSTSPTDTTLRSPWPHPTMKAPKLAACLRETSSPDSARLSGCPDTPVWVIRPLSVASGDLPPLSV